MNETLEKKPPLSMKQYVVRFLLIFVALVVFFSWLLYPRDNTRSSGVAHPEAMGFTSIEKNRIDVVAIGNSNAYSGFSPMELWGEYGFASYVSGEPRQQVASALTLLEKYFETQQPRVVILETDEIFTGNNHLSSAMLSRLENFFPLVKYHNNWKSIRFSTLFQKPQHSYLSPMMGWSAKTDVRAYKGGDYMQCRGETAEIPGAALHYLDKFKALCQEHNAQFVLVSIPCAKTWSDARHNAIAAYAKENGLTYIDLNEVSGTGFDWKTDTSDAGTHLNANGAKKITHYLGEYIKTHCDVKDRRGDAGWQLWEDSYQKFKKDYADS